ncbi:hypothetical protein CLAIMM_09454 isoform 2 [Cladophialophora immunda]|nr:hypothetical protein CLAIMM_09454 isoform 2 [Cladophialophora immunda]
MTPSARQNVQAMASSVIFRPTAAMSRAIVKLSAPGSLSSPAHCPSSVILSSRTWNHYNAPRCPNPDQSCRGVRTTAGQKCSFSTSTPKPTTATWAGNTRAPISPSLSTSRYDTTLRPRNLPVSLSRHIKPKAHVN